VDMVITGLVYVCGIWSATPSRSWLELINFILSLIQLCCVVSMHPDVSDAPCAISWGVITIRFALRVRCVCQIVTLYPVGRPRTTYKKIGNETIYLLDRDNKGNGKGTERERGAK
jgi:hypothetical protein